MRRPLNPALYQINTRILLQELSASLNKRVTLDDIPDERLDQLADAGFNWIWFLGVWQTGAAGQKVSRENPAWQEEYGQLLPGYRPEDICGSPFAVKQYEVNTDFGGNSSLAGLRERLQQRGMRLLLDFVPNHTGMDHPWVDEHPEFYIRGTEEQLQSTPQNFVRLKTSRGSIVLAHGRDPNYPGWPDALQLNYAEPALQAAMRSQLAKVAAMCDGIRCDMAMLMLPDVFERTWGMRPEPFWPKAIESIRASRPDIIFLAEVYWDLEWTLQQQGFNYTYDKRLYDRLREGHARPVRDHFRADLEFQQRSARFLENHDEPRAAATFTPEMHRAAAILTFLCPGLRFFHEGQFEGRTRRVSNHLGRRPQEAIDTSIQDFYSQLQHCIHQPEAEDGKWQLLECTSAWDGNWSWDCFICSTWSKADGRLIIAVNYAPNQSQSRVRLPFEDIRGRVRLQDLMSSTVYERDGKELVDQGLYLDMPAWGYHVFKMTVL
jgi:glycosidase